MARVTKPIRVFFSPLSRRFYATRAYTIDAQNGFVTVTGEQFDVTNDIAFLIEKHNVTFTLREQVEPDKYGDGGAGDDPTE